MSHRRLHLVLVLFAGSGCGGRVRATDSDADVLAHDASTSPGVAADTSDGMVGVDEGLAGEAGCRWPARLQPAAPDFPCAVGRKLLECNYPDRTTTCAVSEDATGCDPALDAGGMCESKCRPDQFAFLCGNEPPPPGVQPVDPVLPDGCVQSPDGPSPYLCCPCE